MNEMHFVPKVSILRDFRFSLKNNWELIVVPAIKEAQERGVLVTPLTVFNYGMIIGWYLHGWMAPPGKITHYDSRKEGSNDKPNIML